MHVYFSMCVFRCIYVCMYVFVCVCVYFFLYVCVRMFLCVCMYWCLCVWCMCVLMCERIFLVYETFYDKTRFVVYKI